MKPFADWPLRARLNLVVAALALPLAALLAAAVWRGAAEREATAAERQLALARAAAADTARFLGRTGELLAALAARPGVSAMARDGCDPVFDTFLAQQPDYANLLLVDAAGRLRCSAQPLALDKPARLGPMYLLALAREARGLVVGRAEFGFVSGRWVVPMVLPLRDAAGGLLGFIGPSVDLARLRPLGASGLLLVDADGLVLAAGEKANPPAATHLDAAGLAALDAAAGRDWSRLDASGMPPRLLARAPVAGAGWYVVAATDAAPLRAAAWRDGVLFGALFLAVLFGGLWLARRLEASVAATTVARDRFAAARRREDELQALLAAGGEAAYLLSADGTALHCLASGSEELLGDAAARRFDADPSLRHTHVLAEDRPQLDALRRQLEQAGRGEAEYRIRRDDGAVRWWRERVRLLRDGEGRPWRLAGFLSDVTVFRELIAGLKESEDRFRSLAELSSDWYWELDADLRFTTLSGGPRAETCRDAIVHGILGRRRWEGAVIGPSEAQWTAHRAQLLRHETFRDFEYGAVLPDGGGTVYIRISGEPVFDAAGNFTGYRGVGSDITARKEAEMQLRKLSAAVEQSPVSIVITDTRGDIEYVNPRFCQATGYAPEEVRGRNPRFLKSGETPAETYATLWQTIAGGGEWSGELHNRRKNGELFWEFVKIIPLLSEKGEVMNYMAVKEDITPYKELTAREQLRQEQMLHHARLAAMGEMAAALAHELNQPLAAIANFSGVVEHQLGAPRPDLAQAREVVRSINAQALRAGNIVWRVREFSRKQEARREPSDINGLIGDVVRLADIAAKSREVDYEYELAAGLPPVPADRVQIEQVLLNLIRNGVEAMDGMDGEKRLRLASRLAENGEAVQISVSDRGRGLPDRIAVDLITPFFTTKPEGMGMGLSISRGIVEAHGGRLWAAPNEDGAGTTFHFTLLLNAEKK